MYTMQNSTIVSSHQTSFNRKWVAWDLEHPVHLEIAEIQGLKDHKDRLAMEAEEPACHQKSRWTNPLLPSFLEAEKTHLLNPPLDLLKNQTLALLVRQWVPLERLPLPEWRPKGLLHMLPTPWVE